MKNLLVTVVIAAAIMTTSQINAQLSTDKEEVIIGQTTSQDEYQEIKIGKLPAAVIKSVKTNFEKAVIGKAYINDLNQYKLVLQIDETEKIVYINAKGEWMTAESTRI